MIRISDKDANEMLVFRASIISENLKKIRRGSGLNQEEVAFLSNVSISTLIAAEKGLNKFGKAFTPDLNTLDKLAKTYSVSLTEIIFKKNG